MACLEHVCRECGWFTFSNTPGSVGACPECGGTQFVTYFDEENDHPVERDEPDEEPEGEDENE
jgi:predicted  nucleic acid-binding Zn-ribbon protein